MNSLRTRLFLIVVAATCLVWFCAIGWVYLGSKAEFERALDNRLREAARMVVSLVSNNPSIAVDYFDSGATAVKRERQMSCQIWSLDGHLIARSHGAPERRMAFDAPGYANRVVGGEMWRSFSVEDPAKGVRVIVGDRVELRQRLVADLVKGLLIPALLAIPALGALLWLSLAHELAPLRDLAGQLRARAADDMTRVDEARAPVEARPLVDALNTLLDNLDAALRHDRDITAFAAHELRTPIAGLKTQAQIALAAADRGVQEGALRQILISVDRMTRLVQQLLTLTRLDAAGATACDESVNVGRILDEVIGAEKPAAHAVTIDVDPALRALEFRSDREMLTMALRNLHENAIQHLAGEGAIAWRLEDSPRCIVIEDNGPGIPEDELPLAPNRFFRGRHKSQTGTGLGLAIVDLAVSRLGGRLALANRADRSGLKASLCFPSLYDA